MIPNLDVTKISEFANQYKDQLDFGIVGPEGLIINGIVDNIEGKLGISMVCPTKEYALEASKVRQHLLMQEVVPEANPEFKVFDPNNYQTQEEVLTDFKNWITELVGVSESVIKPDKPGFGKGVGVGGEHFSTMDAAWAHFRSPFYEKKMIVLRGFSLEPLKSRFFHKRSEGITKPTILIVITVCNNVVVKTR